MKSFILAAIATFTALAGCASTDASVSGQSSSSEPLYYRTGSNIPVRDRKPQTKEEKEQQAEASKAALQEAQQSGSSSFGKP